ncbi:MAG: hypothetical protein NW201_04785 [Gemmatimonadales bacterium]|nr:hypothetical protein [Gemmatimonadales bacterium]
MPKSNRRSRTRGFALEATLVALVLFTALIGAAMTSVISAQRSGTTDVGGSYVTYAAEAAADAVMARLGEVTASRGFVTQANLDSITPATISTAIAGITYDTIRADTAGAEQNTRISQGPYKGLLAAVRPYDVTIKARDAQNNAAKAVVSVKTAAIPIFQFGVFYEGDLEINPGPNMTFAGWVHSNSNIYLFPGATLAFQSYITTPDSIARCRKDNTTPCFGGTVRVNNASAVANLLDFDSRSVTNFSTFRSRSATNFDGRVQTAAHGVTPLRIPLPQGMNPIALIDTMAPADAGDLRDAKFAWKADWHLTVDLAATNPVQALCTAMTTPSVANGNFRRTPGVPPATNGLSVAMQLPQVNTTAVSCDSIFSFGRNTFADSRERRGVEVLGINVRRLRQWVAGDSANRFTEIMYVTFRGANLAATDRDFPAVRLLATDTLPGPRFTFASDRPVYVWGDFNLDLGAWKPAAIIADAVTFLGTTWRDDIGATNFNRNTGCSANNTNPNRSCVPQFGDNLPDTLVINGAVASGHVPTPCDAWRPGCGSPAYSGGLENFPRFLQNWTNRVVRYRGSMVSLFASRYAASAWRSGGVYAAPNRDWAFDLRFEQARNLPAGTPRVSTVTQIAYRPVY